MPPRRRPAWRSPTCCPSSRSRRTLGSAALTIGKLFAPYTGFWDIGASLTQTLFDAGVLLHKKRAADAALDQAAAQYRAAVDARLPECRRRAARAAGGRGGTASRARRPGGRARSVRSRPAAARARHNQCGRLLNAEQNYQQAEIELVQAQANRFADTQRCSRRWAADGGIAAGAARNELTGVA